MNPKPNNRPTDCQVPDCPFNPNAENMCSSCGRTRSKTNFPVFASLAVGNFLIWLFIAVGLCVGIVVSLLGIFFGALSNKQNVKMDSSPMGLLIFGLLLVAAMTGLMVLIVKTRKK